MRWLCGLIALASATAVASPRLDLKLTRDRLDATVTGVAKAEPVFIDDLTRNRRVPAGRVQSVNERGEPFAIAILYEGDENTMGTWSEQEQSTAPAFDVLTPLKAALDHLDLAAALPPGSSVMIADYSKGAEIRQPWEPLDVLSGEKLGRASDYHGKIGTDLVAGVTLALAELAKQPQPHKVLLVIGDGNDTNIGAAQSQLAAIRAATTVDIAAVVVKGPLSSEGSVVGALTDVVRRATPAGIEAALKSAATAATDRFYAEFDARLLDEDGKVHELAIEVAGEQLARANILLPAMPEPSWLSYLVIIGPLMGLGLIILAIYIGRGVLKKAMESEPRRRPFQ